MSRNSLRKIYEEPWVFVWVILFATWLYVNNTNRTAGLVLGLISVTSYIFYKEIKNTKFQINSIKGNVGHSIFIAIIGLVITIIGASFVGWFLGTFDLVSGTISNIGAILEFMKTATLGAQVSPFANNYIINLLIFGFAFPVSETILILSAFKFTTSRFTNKVSLKNPVVWVIAGIMGSFAILYHIYAKMTVPGVPNVNSLMVIWVIFFVECLMTVYAGEQEPAIFHHIINNVVAMNIA